MDGFERDVVLDIAMPVVQGLRISDGDQGRLDYFAERIARDLEKAWVPVHQIAVRSFELYTDPTAVGVALSHEIVLLVAFEVNPRPAEDWFGLVSLCYMGSTMVERQSDLGAYWPEESAVDA